MTLALQWSTFSLVQYAKHLGFIHIDGFIGKLDKENINNLNKIGSTFTSKPDVADRIYEHRSSNQTPYK